MRNERTNNKRRKPVCKDCGCQVGGGYKLRPNGINVMYMLKDALWLKVNDGEKKGHLCLICAQLRLGRKFVPADFKAVPLNFRPRGALESLFPMEFADHMTAFVSDENEEVVTIDVNEDGETACESPTFKAHKQRLTEEVAIEEATDLKKGLVRKRGRPKGSKNKRKRGRPSTHSVKTRKGMAARRKAGKAYTGAVYGYNKGKDGTLSPNWREQLVIAWLDSRVGGRKNARDKLSASTAARILNANGYKGKKGGKWTSTGVLRTIGVDHVERMKTLTQYSVGESWGMDPKYFVTTMAKIKAKHPNPLGFKELTELL